MKENNKFSLSAFFCSLGSKSKIFMFFLLGAPFFLVQFFTLNVCASSVAVPGADGLLVTPSGGVNSPIHNVLKMDTGSINSSLWVALGLDPIDLMDTIEDANSAYQDGNQAVYDAIIQSLNDVDSGSGDLLDYVISSSYQASSQSGYIGKISIPDDVWNRVNKASKNGLDVRIVNPNGGSAMPTITADFVANLFISRGFDISENSYLMSGCATVAQKANNGGCLIYINAENSGEWATQLVLGGSYDYDDGSRYWFQNWTIVEINNSVTRGNVRSGSATQIPHARTITWYYKDFASSSSVLNKHISVASDFITNKANESYDVVSKSSTYNPDTGKIEGARSINLITPEYLSQLVASLRDGILSLPEALQRLGIGAIDSDQAIPIGVGFDIDTLSHVVAQSVPQEATAAATREAFQQLDNFTFYTPDDFIGVPSVSPLPVAMNWLAVQMQTMMGLTSFQNCWVVLSTLAVLSLLVGIIRLSK